MKETDRPELWQTFHTNYARRKRRKAQRQARRASHVMGAQRHQQAVQRLNKWRGQ